MWRLGTELFESMKSEWSIRLRHQATGDGRDTTPCRYRIKSEDPWENVIWKSAS